MDGLQGIDRFDSLLSRHLFTVSMISRGVPINLVNFRDFLRLVNCLLLSLMSVSSAFLDGKFEF